MLQTSTKQKIQMIKVKVFNERKGYIHGLKKSNCLCNTLLYHLPNIGMSCSFNGAPLRNVMCVVIYCVLKKCLMQIRLINLLLVV